MARAAGRIGVAATTAAGLALVLAASWRDDAAGEAAGVPAGPTAAPARSPAPWPGATDAPRTEARPHETGPGVLPAIRPLASASAALGRAMQAPVARRAAPAVGQAEICGHGPVFLPDDNPYGLERLPPALRAAAAARAEALLLASPDEAVRAATLMIGALAPGAGHARDRIEALARSASASSDPAVYAIALQACQATGGDGAASACALLSRTQWARLDADNAVPWLEIAADAEQSGALDAEAEALQRALRAPSVDARPALLPSLIERGLDAAQAAPLERTLALAASWSAQAAWTPSRSAQAARHCTPERLADPLRPRLCEELATRLVERSRSLQERAAGLAIGRALGWAAERMSAMSQEQEALVGAGRLPAIGLDLDCAGVERVQAWMREIAAQGEVQAARSALERSGHSVAQWSERERKELALAAAAADAAAAGSH